MGARMSTATVHVLTVVTTGIEGGGWVEQQVQGLETEFFRDRSSIFGVVK